MNHRAIEPLKQAVARGAILALAAALLLLGCASCSSPGRGLPLTVLSNDLEPLRTEFNQDAGKVRLLLLVDPT